MGDYFRNTKTWELRGSTKPKVLYLCEGESESEYVDVWLTKRNEDKNNVVVLCFQGLSKIKEKISVLIKEPNFEQVRSVCVFIDAESDFSRAKSEVKNMLRDMKFPCSKSKNVPWVESDGDKKSCVFISPDMKNSGRIENVVIKELRNKKEIYDCVKKFQKCSVEAGIKDFDDKKIVHSYIVMNKVGISLGTSFQKGLFDLSHPAYADINHLLEQAIV